MNKLKPLITFVLLAGILAAGLLSSCKKAASNPTYYFNATHNGVGFQGIFEAGFLDKGSLAIVAKAAN